MKHRVAYIELQRGSHFHAGSNAHGYQHIAMIVVATATNFLGQVHDMQQVGLRLRRCDKSTNARHPDHDALIRQLTQRAVDRHT